MIHVNVVFEFVILASISEDHKDQIFVVRLSAMFLGSVCERWATRPVQVVRRLCGGTYAYYKLDWGCHRKLHSGWRNCLVLTTRDAPIIAAEVTHGKEVVQDASANRAR